MDIQCDHVHGTTLTWNERWFNSMFINTLKGLHNIAFTFSTINVSCLHSMPFISKFKKKWNRIFLEMNKIQGIIKLLSVSHSFSPYFMISLYSYSTKWTLSPSLYFYSQTLSFALYLSLTHNRLYMHDIISGSRIFKWADGEGALPPFYFLFRFCGEWREDFNASSMRDVARNTWHFYRLWFHNYGLLYYRDLAAWMFTRTRISSNIDRRDFTGFHTTQAYCQSSTVMNHFPNSIQ